VIRLQILFDKSSLEVFFGNGEKVISSYIFPNPEARGISAVCKKGEAKIETLNIWDLSGVKNE
jgi:fructan beta-fructosidase